MRNLRTTLVIEVGQGYSTGNNIRTALRRSLPDIEELRDVRRTISRVLKNVLQEDDLETGITKL